MRGKQEYISLTDIARYRNSDDPRFAIQNWMRNRNTIEFLGLWESLHNPAFPVFRVGSLKYPGASLARPVCIVLTAPHPCQGRPV